MALCKTCENWNEDYNEFRQMYDDCIVVDDPEPEHQFCEMYNDHIPSEIYYGDADCEYYRQKEEP